MKGWKSCREDGEGGAKLKKKSALLNSGKSGCCLSPRKERKEWVLTVNPEVKADNDC